MKLRQNLAKCKSKLHHTAKIISFNAKNQLKNTKQPTLKLMLSDSCGRKLPTTVIEGNVLIVGSKDVFKHELSEIICTGFIHAGKKAEIISANDFLNMNSEARSDQDINYIIECDPFKVDFDNIKILKDLSGTQIFFKLKGLEWSKRFLCEVSIYMQPISLLDLLDIFHINNDIYLGLMASLDEGEFCVLSGDHMCKRVM